MLWYKILLLDSTPSSLILSFLIPSSLTSSVIKRKSLKFTGGERILILFLNRCGDLKTTS